MKRIRPNGNGFRLDTDMRADGWLVVSEPAWEGWRVYVDGRRVRHYPADVALLGLFVPKGRHDVRLVYLPQAFVTGRAITFVTIGLLAVTTLAIRVRRRKT